VPPKTGAKQSGFVLPVGLFLLVALSISSFSVARIGLFQEKMAGHGVAMTRDLNGAETQLRIDERAFAALDDMTDEALLNSECGVKEFNVQSNGAILRTTYYNPPPNGVNWGSGDGSKVLICHKFENELIISVNAVGDDGSKHSGHIGDYLGNCINGSLEVPDDAWVTCEERFGDTAKRLSWQQLWNI
jgi:Tfp pilus assembly protein PilX